MPITPAVRFWAFPSATEGRGLTGRVRFVLVAALALVMSVMVATASAHDGVHGDDFSHGVEVAPPTGVESAPVAISSRMLSSGPRRVAVILVNFSDLATEPWTADQVRSVVFTGAGSVNAFEQEQSFGTISLAGKLRADGDVFGWFPIAVGSSVCDPDAWMAAANVEATNAGVDLSGYQHYMYMFPKVAACGWAGAADMPGSVSFINGTTSVRVIAHELGHNIGAHHASTISCTDAGVRVSFSASCTLGEYGDPFDVMGSSDRQSGAFRKVGYGFLPAASTATATQTGTYQLASSSLSGAGVRSLRVQRGTNDYWYLELRSPVGQFDDFLAGDPAVTGVGIRQAGGYGTGVRTKLIDTTPATTTYADAPLQTGQTFTDPGTGIAFAVQSLALGIATVDVTIPGTTPAPPPETTPPPPPAGGTTTPPPPPPVARISVRRISRSKMSVRVATDVAAGARSCAMRAGTLRWRSCGIAAGRVIVTRVAPVTKSTVLVMLMIDGELVVAKRVRVPKVGAVVRIASH